jgi:hypothetical protein
LIGQFMQIVLIIKQLVFKCWISLEKSSITQRHLARLSLEHSNPNIILTSSSPNNSIFKASMSQEKLIKK